jgi:hypothetical protein
MHDVYMHPAESWDTSLDPMTGIHPSNSWDHALQQLDSRPSNSWTHTPLTVGITPLQQLRHTPPTARISPNAGLTPDHLPTHPIQNNKPLYKGHDLRSQYNSYNTF